MLKPHTFALIAVTATLCLGFYTYNPFQRSLGMSINSKTAKFGILPQVRLEVISVDTANAIPKIQLLAKVSNPSKDTPITLLRWNSVLDIQAGLLGTISLRNHDNGQEVEVPTIMVNRQMPPPKDEYLQVAPGTSVENTVTLALTTSKLDSGAEYEASAKGQFMEVYQGEDDEPTRVVPYQCEPVRFKAS